MFDAQKALQQAGDDPDLLAEVLGVFVDESAGWARDIQDAAAARDAERLRRAAHTVKGAASNCGAAQTAALASSVEHLASGGDIGIAAESAADLVTQLHKLANSVRDYLRAQERDAGARA